MPNFAIKLNKIKLLWLDLCVFAAKAATNISNGCFEYSRSLRVSEANEVPVCSHIGSLDGIQTALKADSDYQFLLTLCIVNMFSLSVSRTLQIGFGNCPKEDDY